jgi:hypothetical protein
LYTTTFFSFKKLRRSLILGHNIAPKLHKGILFSLCKQAEAELLKAAFVGIANVVIAPVKCGVSELTAVLELVLSSTRSII